MKKIFFNLNLFLFFLLIGKIASAQDVITVEELGKIKDKNTVIVAAVKPEDYAKTHIKDAIHVLHKDLYKTAGPEGILKPAAEIAQILGAKGISNTNLIVLYDDGEGKYSGRMYWILKYLGCKNVKILDGHIKAWKSARKPVTATATVAKKVTFTASPNDALLADMKDVKAGNSLVVDVRSAAEYNGTDDSKLARKGHIPGAINFEFKQVLSEGKLKEKSELEAMFKKAGMTKDKNIILYCETSVRAGIVFFALGECGYTKVQVYDGALNEWIATASNKVDK